MTKAKRKRPHYPKKTGANYSEHNPGFFFVDSMGKKHKLIVNDFSMEQYKSFSLGQIQFVVSNDLYHELSKVDFI